MNRNDRHRRLSRALVDAIAAPLIVDPCDDGPSPPRQIGTSH
jgi:hypothetical protein